MSGATARLAAAALLVALALPLAGCETTGGGLSTAVTKPGQYDLYECPDIKTAALLVTKRQRELEGLMARANRGPAGGFISASTYQPEYLTLRGQMDQLRSAAVEKHCNFVPGAAPAVQPSLPPPPRQTSR